MCDLTDEVKSEIRLEVLRGHLELDQLTVSEAYSIIKDSPLRNMPLKEFCARVLGTKAGLSKPMSFSDVKPEIISESNLDPEPEPELEKKAQWEEWPQSLRDEIAFVLDQNDQGLRKISLREYMDRITNDWEVEASEHDVKTFCKTLGRKGWSK